MNILWAGGEDIDFTGTFAIESSTSYRRDGYARHALRVNGNNLTYKSTPAFSGITSGWLSAQVWKQGSGQDCPRVLGFGLAGGTKGIFAGFNTDNPSKVTISKYDGSTNTVLATGASGVVSNSVLYKIDVQLISYGASGTVNVYVDGTLAVTYTGDLSITDVASFDSVFAGESPNISSQWHALSEFIVADDDTRALSLVTLAPNAAGDTNEWTGAYTDIDEETVSDADLVYVDSDAKDFQANLTATPAGTFTVDGIVIKARALVTGDAAIATLKLGVKSGGTVDVDAGQEPTTSWATYQRVAATINGAQLTTALLDALQLDLRSAT